MEINLTQETDATVWTSEWLKTIKKNPAIPTDEGTMIAWFANAIMAGHDWAMRKDKASESSHCHETHVEAIAVIDEWKTRNDEYRLVSKGAGPAELQHFEGGSWIPERSHFTHSTLCQRIASLSENH